ncbi:LacI family DNA-binding transcriptional regulator [Leifsonia sp. F6_8S_P_1B]|uniref:LacI family DNA-binding transcriptional regulator n=1 Tax=Leifsonia williamsii TaxID=3035919 RepID=A0ABT8K6Z8_9MICO|nr:LacI family DNA-binding transcriptional regulator [Leifsonia williamsii]MDN4613220.1 LacI family DNA-binding transcriptional regulator [Leifsonia williamsii]
MSDKAPTLVEVAAHAGVSLATASRVLNGSERRVKPDLQERVLASARSLGYSANVQAQAVARGTSNVVALVVGDIADPYFSSIASGVMHVADERGLIVTITATGPYAGAESVAREEAALAALRGQRPRAVVLAGSRVVGVEAAGGSAAGAFSASSERVAAIGSGAPGLRSIAVDNAGGAAALARELRGLGYADFSVLAGPPELVTVRERVDGFRSVVLGADVRHAEFSREGGHRAMAELLASGARPDCVFAVTDVMAVGAMTAVREAGLTPGADIALAGFDDIPLAADLAPALTSVSLPLAEIGARALELALADTPAADAPAITAEVRLRASTPGH